MRDLSHHILDLAENSIEAGARLIEIRIVENSRRDRMIFEIADDGKGMDKERLERARSPFFSTKKERRIGLGLPMLVQAARAAGGTFSLSSRPGGGTRVRATFQRSHIDRQAIGDIAETMTVLIIGHPEIDIRYVHKIDGRGYVFDTRNFRRQLGADSIAAPHALDLIAQDIRDGLARIRRTH